MQKGKHQFEALFIPQAEGGFTAEVVDLPGCVSEGDTLDEAERNIRKAIELYLEVLEKRGVPLPDRSQDRMFRLQIAV
jgi:predicted RNase H-like HicB family nuclease